VPSLPDAPEDPYELVTVPRNHLQDILLRLGGPTNAQVLFLLNNASEFRMELLHHALRLAEEWNGQGQDLRSVFRLRGRGASCGSVVIERLEEGISGSALRKSILVVGSIPDLGLWS
jgi:hypothetical protein